MIEKLNKVITEELTLSKKYDEAHKKVMTHIKTKKENLKGIKKLAELLRIKKENPNLKPTSNNDNEEDDDSGT